MYFCPANIFADIMRKSRIVLKKYPNTLKITVFTGILIGILSACSTTQKLPEGEIASKEMLRADVSFLASDALEGRQVGTEGEKKAAIYIAARMEDLGLKTGGTDGYFQTFSVKKTANPHEMEFGGNDSSSITGRNVIGRIDNQALSTIIIGAHYDHLGYGGFGSLYTGEPAIHNGADDNASGVAGMLYLANRLQSCCDNYNFAFIAFSGEERGLWGSNYFTDNPSIDLDKVNYMVNMDMIGRMKPERSLAIYGNGTSPSWDNLLEQANKDSIKLVLDPSGIGPSDHTSFYLEDIPVLHFFTGQHEDYHKPSDDEEKINYGGMLEVLQMIHRIIVEANTMDTLAFTETPDTSQAGMRSFKVTLGVIPDYLFDGEGMRIDGVRPGRPAANAGLEDGDIVINMGDIEVSSMDSYMDALSQFEPGQTIIIIVKRDDEVLEKELQFD